MLVVSKGRSSLSTNLSVMIILSISLLVFSKEYISAIYNIPYVSSFIVSSDLVVPFTEYTQTGLIV